TLFKGYSAGAVRSLLYAAVENPQREARGFPTANPFTSQFVQVQSPYAKIGQFYDRMEDLTNLNRRRESEGLSSLNRQEQRLVTLYDEWQEIDSKYRSRRGKVTRNKSLSEAARQRAYDRLYEARSREQTKMLERIRDVLGKPAGS